MISIEFIIAFLPFTPTRTVAGDLSEKRPSRLTLIRFSVYIGYVGFLLYPNLATTWCICPARGVSLDKPCVDKPMEPCRAAETEPLALQYAIRSLKSLFLNVLLPLRAAVGNRGGGDNAVEVQRREVFVAGILRFLTGRSRRAQCCRMVLPSKRIVGPRAYRMPSAKNSSREPRYCRFHCSPDEGWSSPTESEL